MSSESKIAASAKISASAAQAVGPQAIQKKAVGVIQNMEAQEPDVEQEADLIQRKENKTGMPDQLKSGVESLSGMSMDHVKVHYNSSQPAQLNALAYAQGSDIHIGPGQEKHLPHEAWHVVQQAQGRVQATTQMKTGVAVNDDPGLEQEADVMGAKAATMNSIQPLNDMSVAATEKSRTSQLKIIQKYTVERDGYMVSEGEQFAVKEHGERNSEMLIHDPGKIKALGQIVFEPGEKKTLGIKEYTSLIPRYKSEKDKREMEQMYCGKFSNHVTGKAETQESNDAPTGRSLYMKVHAPVSAWENHYAPVIIQDGGDRGTFETAVGLDYIFFGIYGQALQQSFAYKTEIAGIMLELQNDTIGKGLLHQHQENLAKGKPGYDKEIKDNELAKQKARSVVEMLRHPEDGKDSKDSKDGGKKEEVEIESRKLLQKISEHQRKNFDLEAQLALEEKERQKLERDQAERAEQERKATIKKISLGIVAIIGLIILLIVLL